MNYPGKPSTTAGQHTFASIPAPDIQRSAFDRSSGTKTSFMAGQLIPVWCDEALPGDTITLSANFFARLSTLLHPIMDNVFLDFFVFAVPHRILWDNWVRMNGEQDNPDDPTDFITPYMDSPAITGHLEESLSDFIGIPPGVPDLRHNVWWHRAYNAIFNAWFRDQNLQDSAWMDKTSDGPDDPANFVILNRGKRHDYFTSSLPWAQKGQAVTLPLGTEAEIVPTGDGSPTFNVNAQLNMNLQGAAGGTSNVVFDASPAGAQADAIWNNTKLVADLSGATAATINSIREAFQFQKLIERDARGGTRYVEVIKSQFGVTSPDFRLQRPEFLGGKTVPVIGQAVEMTSQTGGAIGGALAGYGTAAGTANINKSFTEHCVLMGIISARADLNYQQGLPRMFSRSTRFDYYWPPLAHLGEQEVKNKEIYAQGSAAPAVDEEAWGYQERWAEYRYKTSQCTGAMRSSHSLTLDTWHLAQEFGALPVLGNTFIKENPPIDRVVAFEENHFVMDSWFQCKHARPMPTYSVPGWVDHF